MHFWALKYAKIPALHLEKYLIFNFFLNMYKLHEIYIHLYIHICMCIYIYLHIHICVYSYTHSYTYLYSYTYTYIYILYIHILYLYSYIPIHISYLYIIYEYSVKVYKFYEIFEGIAGKNKNEFFEKILSNILFLLTSFLSIKY